MKLNLALEPSETTKDPTGPREPKAETAEIAILMDMRGRVVGAASPENMAAIEPIPVALDFSMDLKLEQLQVRIEELFEAAAHWNISEIIQALSNHLDNLNFRLITAQSEKTAAEKEIGIYKRSTHAQLEQARQALRQIIMLGGIKELQRDVETYQLLNDRIATLTRLGRFFAFRERGMMKEAHRRIPREIFQFRIGIKFVGDEVQIGFQKGSKGYLETEKLQKSLTVSENLAREANEISEKIHLIERGLEDLRSMNFSAPN